MTGVAVPGSGDGVGDAVGTGGGVGVGVFRSGKFGVGAFGVEGGRGAAGARFAGPLVRLEYLVAPAAGGGDDVARLLEIARRELEVGVRLRHELSPHRSR